MKPTLLDAMMAAAFVASPKPPAGKHYRDKSCP